MVTGWHWLVRRFTTISFHRTSGTALKLEYNKNQIDVIVILN